MQEGCTSKAEGCSTGGRGAKGAQRGCKGGAKGVQRGCKGGAPPKVRGSRGVQQNKYDDCSSKNTQEVEVTNIIRFRDKSMYDPEQK